MLYGLFFRLCALVITAGLGVLDIKGSRNRKEPGSADPHHGRMCHVTFTNAVIGRLHCLPTVEHFGRLALEASLSTLSSCSSRPDQGSVLGLEGVLDLTRSPICDPGSHSRPAYLFLDKGVPIFTSAKALGKRFVQFN